MRSCLLSACLFATFVVPAGCADKKPGWKAGVARKVITPEEPIWMAGYAGRNKPAEGKVHDLHVKALALEDPSGKQFVLVTSDLIGIPRATSEYVAGEVAKKAKLPRERLILSASHTHCGPVVVRDGLTDMYQMPEDQPKKLAAYGEKLNGLIVEAVLDALKNLKPAKLSYGEGSAAFAVNRREKTDTGVKIGVNKDGPVDHSVPVLCVEVDDKILAALFGYACHNTTLDFYQWCGDYAGFAQAAVETRHPGTTAMFWTGCGADANPNPRRQLELAQQYGKDLAATVHDVLTAKRTPIGGDAAAKYETIALPFGKIPGKEKWTADLLSKTHAERKRAEKLLKELENGGKIDDHYRHYPVQVWRLGDGPLWVALGGEVVVDYAFRLKKELKGDKPVWVMGYANNVMSYIPSARVLEEGGYEADSSMMYYGMPAKWSPAIEDQIVKKVRELAK